MPRPRASRPTPEPGPEGCDDSPENLRRIVDELMDSFDRMHAQILLKERQAVSPVVAPPPVL